MNTKKLIASAILALGLAVAASAQQVSAGLGDLVLGFSKSGNQNNVEVTLGSITNFLSGGSYATGSEVFLSSLNVADLNATYGAGTGSAGWKSTATSWGVGGTNGAGGGNTIWTTSTAAITAGSDQGSGANSLATIYTALSATNSTANSASTGVLATANAGSWTSIGGPVKYLQFPSNTVIRNNGGLATLGGSSSMSFYEVLENGGTGAFLGTFKLYDNGNFSFTAIPEPSTYAALLGVATLGVVAIRRRRQAAQEVAV